MTLPNRNIFLLEQLIMDNHEAAQTLATMIDRIAANGAPWQNSVAYEHPAKVTHDGYPWASKKNVPAGTTPAEGDFWYKDVIRYSMLDNPMCHILKKNKLKDTLVGDVNWTRSTTATYVDPYGVLKTAGIDEPRQEKEGWLIEGESTNLCLWSEDATKSPWTFGSGITKSAIIARDGYNMIEIRQEGLNGYHCVSQNISDVNSVAVVSVNVDTTNWKSFGVGLRVNGSILNCKFEVDSAGNITQSISPYLTATIEKIKDNRYKLVIVCQPGLSEIAPKMFAVGWSGGSTSFLGSDTSASLLFSALQVEALPFPTSYIPTTGSPVTRARDVVSIPLTGNISPIKTPWSVFCKTSHIPAIGTSRVLYKMYSDTDPYEGRVLRYSGSAANVGKLYSYLDYGFSLNVSSAIQHPVGITVAESVATTYDGSSSFKLYQNGTMSQDSHGTRSTTLSGSSIITIGEYAGGTGNLNGHISDFRIYDFVLNQAEVNFLSGS